MLKGTIRSVAVGVAVAVAVAILFLAIFDEPPLRFETTIEYHGMYRAALEQWWNSESLAFAPEDTGDFPVVVSDRLIDPENLAELDRLWVAYREDRLVFLFTDGDETLVHYAEVVVDPIRPLSVDSTLYLPVTYTVRPESLYLTEDGALKVVAERDPEVFRSTFISLVFGLGSSASVLFALKELWDRIPQKQ